MADSRGHFRPCLGKTACTDGGTQCRACGHSFDEIERPRILEQGLTELVPEMDYDNPGEFADYVARRIATKVGHAREQKTAVS